MTDESESLNEVVARSLRRIRAARGISLAGLARDSGVARATLYQLEAGQGNPTMDTLFAVASVLRVPLSDLVTNSSPPSVRVVRAGQGTSVGSGSRVSARLLRRFESSTMVLELYDLKVPAGARTEAHEHPSGVFEHVLVASGILLTGAQQCPALLNPGDYICFRADLPHVYQAERADVTATLIMEYPSPS